jgi:hypothetical protein
MAGSVLVFALSGIICLVALSARATDNPLIGTWKQDWSKTLQELEDPATGSEQLKIDAARAKRFVLGGVRNLRDRKSPNTKAFCRFLWVFALDS